MRTCPKCKTTDFNNRNFALMINECGHSLCSNCVSTLFARNTGPCPTCGKTLKLKGFWVQTLEDPMVEKEVYFRKKLSRTFNLLEDDFDSLRQFNDYLEMIETTVYNLVHDKDLEETSRNVQKFQKDHEPQINRNKNRHSQDDIFIQQCLDEELKAKKMKQIAKSAPDEKGASDERQAAKALIAALRDSQMPAEVIVNSKRRDLADQEMMNREKNKTKKPKIEVKHETVLRPLQEIQGQPFVYEQLVLDLNGPPLPDFHTLTSVGHLGHIKAANEAQLAGGYHHMLACYRALTEASCDLYWLPTKK